MGGLRRGGIDDVDPVATGDGFCELGDDALVANPASIAFLFGRRTDVTGKLEKPRREELELGRLLLVTECPSEASTGETVKFRSASVKKGLRREFEPDGEV
jgi:hypothetical protein